MSPATLLADNLRRIMERIERARERVTQPVTVIGVSKRQPDLLVREALELGVRNFGENYVQELVRRRSLFPEATWHLIGHLQTNKAKQAVQANLIHTIDGDRAAAALARHIDPGQPMSILIQVNTSGEESKSGCSEQELEPLIQRLLAMPVFRVRGLMCVPTRGASRGEYARLRELRDAIERSLACALPELSMGMSADFEDAILEGATMVRLGTILFGARPDRTDPGPAATG